MTFGATPKTPGGARRTQANAHAPRGTVGRGTPPIEEYLDEHGHRRAARAIPAREGEKRAQLDFGPMSLEKEAGWTGFADPLGGSMRVSSLSHSFSAGGEGGGGEPLPGALSAAFSSRARVPDRILNASSRSVSTGTKKAPQLAPQLAPRLAPRLPARGASRRSRRPGVLQQAVRADDRFENRFDPGFDDDDDDACVFKLRRSELGLSNSSLDRFVGGGNAPPPRLVVPGGPEGTDDAAGDGGWSPERARQRHRCTLTASEATTTTPPARGGSEFALCGAGRQTRAEDVRRGRGAGGPRGPGIRRADSSRPRPSSTALHGRLAGGGGRGGKKGKTAEKACTWTGRDRGRTPRGVIRRRRSSGRRGAASGVGDEDRLRGCRPKRRRRRPRDRADRGDARAPPRLQRHRVLPQRIASHPRRRRRRRAGALLRRRVRSASDDAGEPDHRECRTCRRAGDTRGARTAAPAGTAGGGIGGAGGWSSRPGAGPVVDLGKTNQQPGVLDARGSAPVHPRPHPVRGRAAEHGAPADGCPRRDGWGDADDVGRRQREGTAG